jgi:hypothetical protein
VADLQGESQRTRSESRPSVLDVYQGRPLTTVPELVALVLLR